MASLASLQKRYQRGLDNFDFYAAEQACRMMHHRLTQSKNSTTADRDEAVSILVDGAKSLLSHSQVQAGTALGLLVMKHYVDYKVAISRESMDRIETIYSAYITNTKLEHEGLKERLRFARAAATWSTRKDCGGYTHGHARINRFAAHAAAEAGDFNLAQKLFIHSDDPDGAAEALAKYARDETLASERELVLTRAVLRFLASQNIADAHLFRKQFATHMGWPGVENGGGRGAEDVPPLANFCEILVKVCQLENAAAPLFERVCQSYRPALQRDVSFEGLLVKIGTMYFNIAPPQPAGLAGVMGNMLRGMMNT